MKLLEFEFKGERDYVHGTDMVNKFLNLFQNADSLSIKIRKITTENLYLVKEINDSKLVASLVLNSGENNSEKFYLVESGTEAKGRYPYNEEELVESAQIDLDSETVEMKTDNSYTLVENIVALHKKLVTKAISSDVKWLFVELKLNLIPKKMEKNDSLSINIEKKLGVKLVESGILFNNKNIGFIRFSSINKG